VLSSIEPAGCIKAQPDCTESKDNWHLTWFTVVLIVLNGLPMVVGLMWFITTVVARDATDRMADIRDNALWAIHLPYASVEWILRALWNWTASRLVEGPNKDTPRDPAAIAFSREPESRRALHAAAITAGFLTILTIVASMPAIPGVDACELSGGVESCAVPAFIVQQVGSGYYYVNTTSYVTIGISSGDRAMRYVSTNIDTVIACNGDKPANLPNGYALTGLWAIPTGGEATISASVCFGASVGVAFTPDFVGAVISAVAVYCPESTATVNLEVNPVSAYTNWATAQYESQWTARVSINPSLCQLNVGCQEFPTLGTGYNSLFITASGISDSAFGAIAEVLPPGFSGGFEVDGSCNGTDCYGRGREHGDCPSGIQFPDMSATETGLGGVPYNPELQLEIDPYFQASRPGFFLKPALACAVPPANANGNPTGLVQFSSSGAACTDAGKTSIPGCQGHKSWALTGTTSPVPSDDGRRVLFTCESPTGTSSTWIVPGSQPPPVIKPGQEGCTTQQTANVECTVCSSGVLCYPRTGEPPVQVLSGGGASEIANGTWVFPTTASGGMCRLDVTAFGADYITFNPLNPPCMTTGEMGTAVLESQTRLEVRANGWLSQTILNGTLWWPFNAHYKPPASETVNQTGSVSLNPLPCTDTECRCCPDDCAGELVCLMLLDSWRGCKCALISGCPASGSIECEVTVTLVRVIFYTLFVVLSILTLCCILKAAQKKCSKEDNDKS
jgi:hypothetical protein